MLLPRPSKQWLLVQQVQKLCNVISTFNCFMLSNPQCKYCGADPTTTLQKYINNLQQYFKNVDCHMRTTNTKNYIKFALPIAVLLELVLLKQWFCYPCILHPWGIKIFKDTEKLTACILWDATIDGSEKFFRGMPCLCDLKYVLKASYLQTKE